MSSLNKLLVYYFYECYFYLSTVLKSEIRNMRLINTFFVYKFLAISCTSVFVLCIVRAKLNSYFAKVFPLFTFHSSFRFAWRRYFWLLNGILCIFQSILLHFEFLLLQISFIVYSFKNGSVSLVRKFILAIEVTYGRKNI